MSRHEVVCLSHTGPRLPSSDRQASTNEPKQRDIESRIPNSVSTQAVDSFVMSSEEDNASDTRTVLKKVQTTRQQGKKKLRKRKNIDEGSCTN